jgi:hypothetical protein
VTVKLWRRPFDSYEHPADMPADRLPVDVAEQVAATDRAGYPADMLVDSEFDAQFDAFMSA